MHPDGAIAIMDRSKDIIISGGEVNIRIYDPNQRLSLSRAECFFPCHRTRYADFISH